MRILQVNNYADPVGGAEVYALSLTRELRSRGHEVAFFGTAPDRETASDELTVVRRPRYDAALLFQDPLVAGALEAKLRSFRPDLVHVHNVFSLGIDVLTALGSAPDLPIVQTVHDFSLLCPNSWCVWADGTPCPGGAGAKCYEHGCEQNYPFDADVALHTLLKQRVLASCVDLTICPSRHLSELMRAGGSRRVVHLNYFIDPIASEAGLERGDGHLVFIGRLQPEKGVEHLLQAMPLIRRERPDVRLTVVGGGDLAGELRERSRALGLDGVVTFLDHVPREELGRFYATATACVLPSVWSENSPLVAYECLAAGLPMIASRIGGIPELAVDGEAGFTFTPRDPEGLAASALRLFGLSAEERARLSARMRERARSFRAEPHVDRIEELYGELRAPGRTESGAIDADLLTLLARSREEKQRLSGYFLEHVAHIRHLERAIAERDATRPGTSAGVQDAAQAPAPDRVLGRLARILRSGGKRGG